LVSNITLTNRGATSFGVYAEFDCSPVGLQDAQSIAETALAKVEGYQLEKAFWSGVAGKTSVGGVAQTTVFPHLAANAALIDPGNSTITLQPAANTSVTGGPTTDVADGLGQLQGALAACYHGVGVIHIPTAALPTLVAWDLVEDDGNGALWTPTGNRVVVGHGYSNTSPAGVAAAAGTAWIYGTGAVFGYSSPVKVPTLVEQFDRTENTYHLIAERIYVIGFECCLYATQIQLGVPT
jgi:subtilisin family serine protease